tara:strand:+ start:914 stop:1069 length:156 start_codon:yes stop_codon:yes gene_type:complete
MKMTELPSIELLLSYGLLAGGALVIFGLLSLFKDYIEKDQRKIKKKRKKKK